MIKRIFMGTCLAGLVGLLVTFIIAVSMILAGHGEDPVSTPVLMLGTLSMLVAVLSGVGLATAEILS